MPDRTAPSSPSKTLPLPGTLLGDLGVVWARRRTLWRRLRRSEKLGFFGAVAVTGIVTYIQVRIAVLIGDFFNEILKRTGEGRVVEEGSYDDLVEKNGTFAELVPSAEAA